MHETSFIHKDVIWLVYFLQKNFVESRQSLTMHFYTYLVLPQFQPHLRTQSLWKELQEV
jgi:hypothetical protein